MSVLDAERRFTASPAPSEGDYPKRARALRELIEAQAAVTEKGGTLSPVVVEAMRDAGLFWMSMPKELGGGGDTFVEAMKVVEEVAFADGSSGWSLMANQGTIVAASVYLGDEGVGEIFGEGKLPILAGMLGPAGKSTVDGDGYRAGGKFAFGSGMAHADWIGAGMLVMDDGKPRMLPGGPEVRVCFIPKDRVEVLGNWNPPGLVGTGSYDYEVPWQMVPAGFSFERTTLVPMRGGPRFTLGLAVIGASGHAAVVLGLMKRGLVEIVRIASGKKRPGYSGPVADNDVFKHQFMLREAAYQGARDYAYRAFQDAEDCAASGQELTAEQRARIRQATTWVHQVADDVVRFCHLWSGSEVIRPDTALGRVSRDMAIATQHVVVDPITLVDGAPAVMQAWLA